MFIVFHLQLLIKDIKMEIQQGIIQTVKMESTWTSDGPSSVCKALEGTNSNVFCTICFPVNIGIRFWKSDISATFQCLLHSKDKRLQSVCEWILDICM